MTTQRPRPADSVPAEETVGGNVSDRVDRDRPRSDRHAVHSEAKSEEKPVDEWVTGDEPMTGPQRSYLQTLAHEAGEDLPDEEMTKAAASELIERLQRATGRIPADRDR